MSASAALYSGATIAQGAKGRNLIFKGTLRECTDICRSNPKLVDEGCHIESLDETGRRFEADEIATLLL
jgi:hypothetical protein